MKDFPYETGDVVRAFHPAEMGVVREGRIVRIGRKWVYVDFGMRGGIVRVIPRHVVDRAAD